MTSIPADYDIVIGLINEIRRIRINNKLTSRQLVTVTLDTLSEHEIDVFTEYKNFIQKLTKSKVYFSTVPAVDIPDDIK